MLDFWNRRRTVILVVLLGALLRVWAGWQLPLDADEPVYLQAGYDYARLLRAGDLNGLINFPLNAEHPPLVKLSYALAVLVQGEEATWDNSLFLSRSISVVFGILAVWVAALVSPLAGALLAVQTMVVKYTSQAYLEAWPLCFSLVAVLSLRRSQVARDRWFWISALALGLVAAGKYSYFPIICVILYLFFWERKYPSINLLLYLAVAALTFWVFNPALWNDPFGRLLASLSFHTGYSQSTHVQLSGYPWYQPFLWVSRSMPYQWHPEVFFYYGFDGLIALLAFVGLRWEWRQRRWVVVWLASGMLFLLLWPTKWPQYSLVVLPAVCFSAAVTADKIYRWVLEEDTYWNWIREMFPRPSKSWVILSVGLVILVMLGELGSTVRHALNNRGWWHLNAHNTPLPSNAVYQVLSGPDRQMVVASEGGAVIFTLSTDTTLPESSEVYHTGNSGLPANRVLAVTRDASGALWFGTQSGLSRYAHGEWRTFRGLDFGLPGEQVQALETGSDGRLWLGTNAGLAVYDGAAWQSFTSSAGLVNDFVTSLAVDRRPAGDMIWVGTRDGLSRLDTAKGKWTTFSAQDTGQGGGSISHLLLDSQGRLWVATLGGGLNLWDGSTWSSYRVSNSAIPSNTVTTVVEVQPGEFWVATATPAEAGGALARFNGQHWYTYTTGNSGFSGAEPLSIVLDQEGRLWIGTRTAGVDVYQLKK